MPRNRTPQSIAQVVENGLCSGCGLCEGIAGRQRVRMVTTPAGQERPLVRQPLEPEIMTQVLAACPGVHIRGLPAARIGPATVRDPLWGPYRRIVSAWAADPAIRANAATGGVLSALAVHLLDTGRVTHVLHVAASRVRPLRSSACLSTGRADVLRGAGARLGPASILPGLIGLLDRRQPFAIIGKPCDIAAVNNLARIDSRVDDYCRYRLSMLCAGAPGHGAAGDRLRRVGIAEDDLTRVRFFGYGSSTRLFAETRIGWHVDIPFSLQADLPLAHRCRICPDGVGSAADLVAGDLTADDGTGSGVNVVIARTGGGLALLESAAGEGAVVIGGDHPVAELTAQQPDLVRQRYRAWARLLALANAGRPMPDVSALDLGALARQHGLAANLAEVRDVLAGLLDGGGIEQPVRHAGGF